MGFLSSLIIHSIFLFLSSYIHIGRVEEQKERLIEVSLVSIPEIPQKKETLFVEKRIKEPIIPLVRNKSISFLKPKRHSSLVKGDEMPPLRWQPKMPISKEIPPKNEGKKTNQGEGAKLDIANTSGDMQIKEEMKGKEGREGAIEGGSYALEIEGEVARRQIFYQEGFNLPEWLEKKGISLEAMFKFWVLPDGSVDRVSIEHSFGYRELDSLAISAILRWRFCPLKGGMYEEWGIAKIKIKLK